MSKGPVRRIRLSAVVAYPAVSVALMAAMALALTPFGPSQMMALAAEVTPTATSTPTATVTSDPTTAPTTDAPTTAAPTTATAVPSPVPGPVPTPTAAAGDAPVNHHVLAWIEGSAIPAANYLPVDAPALDAPQFQTFRVRFQLHNSGTVPMTATPQLEYRAEGAAGFAVVPETAQLGVAFHIAREWISSLGPGDGTHQGPLGEDIAVGDLKMVSAAGVATKGHHSMAANPDAPITLPPGSYTEEEFTVRLSIDAQYLTGYELRITDGGTALTGTDAAAIRLGSAPAVQLSPGQRQGVSVDGPAATNAASVSYPLLSAPLTSVDTASSSAAPAVSSRSAALYPLASGSLLPATVASSSTVAVVTSGTGGPHDMAEAQCGVCHRGHAAQSPNLSTQPGGQSALCFSCHDGSGAAKNVKSEYFPVSVPANVPDKREYYSHDAVIPTASTKHTLDPDEFSGKLNRHSECADCHNSHKANTTDSTTTTGGWDASGRLAGVSGVSVRNGDAGAAPAYTFLSGADTNVVPANLVTREYQLCLKCHSGFTTLTDNAGLKPSQYALDKGVEFNPANASFHPVEAKGTNRTARMDLSLDGTSPYKLWNFNADSTIRCLNCHATGTTPGPPPPTATELPLPGSALAPHTSVNRGILLRNYQDRVLKSTTALYSGGDFALCYVCHGEEPFANSAAPFASNATNFRLHGLHLNKLANKSSGPTAGTDIDVSGDGQGNAICAECHFRIHSTTNKVGEPGGSRLVNFAPNVESLGTATPSWTRNTTTGIASCTLTCHGEDHSGAEYLSP